MKLITSLLFLALAVPLSAGAAAPSGAEGGTAQIGISSFDIENTTAWGGYSGTLEIFNPAGTTHYKTVGGSGYFMDTSGFLLNVLFRGSYEAATAVTDVRFLMSSGDIASGSIYCYGVQKTP